MCLLGGIALPSFAQQLAKPTPSTPSSELLECLTCTNDDTHHCAFDQTLAIWELQDRRQTELLINTYKKSKDECQREYIVQLLLSIGDEMEAPRITEFMRTVPTGGLDKEAFYALLYLAERGDEPSLRTLNENYFRYPVSSVDWGQAVAAFSRYRYRPALCNIIGSLYAASLNLVEEADKGLHKFFPDAPKQFSSLDEMQKYFERRGHELRPPCPAPQQ